MFLVVLSSFSSLDCFFFGKISSVFILTVIYFLAMINRILSNDLVSISDEKRGILE